MSEGAARFSDVPVLSSASSRMTAGGLLRAARERDGLHIAALAVSMKVPVKKLEALEADRHDLLLDAGFVRALAASVCRSLKIDSAPVLELLPASAPPRLDSDNRGINTPFNVAGLASNGSLQSFLLAPPALMVLALMVAAVAVYFYPFALRDATVSDKLQAVTPAATAVSVPEVVPGNAETVLLPAISTPASATQGELPQVPVVNVSPIATAPVAAASLPVAAQTNVLQFKARGTAWVQVTDAKGVQILSRTLQPGEVVGVAGAFPLAVVVGRVDLTSVELHGKPFDLSAVEQNNVARFEVKQ